MFCYIDEARTPSQRRLASCIARWRRVGDRRVLFAAAHAMAIDNVMATARAGRFVESAWVCDLVREWLEYYLITVEPDDDDLSLVTPPAWKDGHSATAATRITAAPEALMLAVNAHVNNDLAQALADALRAEWPLSTMRLERRRADFDRLTSVVADTMDGMQHLVTRFESVLTDGCARGGEQANALWNIRQLIEAWHEDVWRDALMLVTAVDASWTTAVREAIECNAARRGHLLMCRIQDREHLVLQPAAMLDRVFPQHHAAAECRLSGRPPVWGGQVPARAF
jgi:hypothetical protein